MSEREGWKERDGMGAGNAYNTRIDTKSVVFITLSTLRHHRISEEGKPTAFRAHEHIPFEIRHDMYFRYKHADISHDVLAGILARELVNLT